MTVPSFFSVLLYPSMEANLSETRYGLVERFRGPNVGQVTFGLRSETPL